MKNVNRVQKHKEICEELNKIYATKNHDYGNSFKDVRDKIPNAILVRVLDKTNRLTQLMTKGEQQVKDESIKDTLLDLANYCIMEIIEMNYDELNNAQIKENIKPKFKLYDYKRNSYCMHCPTQKKADVFLKFLHKNGRKWDSKTSYADEDRWYIFGKNTCYFFNLGLVGNFLIESDSKILEFDDFDWKEDKNE